MALQHFDHDGRARFVTFITHRRIPLLTNDLFRATVVSAIEAAALKFSCTLLAWVIMPEHVHVVVVPAVETRLSEVISAIKRTSAREIHAVLTRHSSPLLPRLTIVRDGEQRFVFWQKRCFDRNCRSEDEVRRTVEYCHSNPVKRGLVKRAEDYRWSSAQRYETINTPE